MFLFFPPCDTVCSSYSQWADAYIGRMAETELVQCSLLDDHRACSKQPAVAAAAAAAAQGTLLCRCSFAAAAVSSRSKQASTYKQAPP